MKEFPAFDSAGESRGHLRDQRTFLARLPAHPAAGGEAAYLTAITRDLSLIPRSGRWRSERYRTGLVQRELGEHLQAGYALRDDDVGEIRALLARRDTQIKFLYERELEFSALISGMMGSPSFRIGRAITWPARAVRRWLGAK